MATFVKADLLNQLARLFTTGILPTRESGGLVASERTFNQLRDLFTLSLLLHPRGVFHLARLARNRLVSLVDQELALVEDMCVLLDALERAIRNSATDLSKSGAQELAEARTALLNLAFEQASSALERRPEVDQFRSHIDAFATTVAPNVVGPGGKLSYPRGEARARLSTNLVRLKLVHGQLLAGLGPLRDMIEELRVLDLANRATSSALSNIQRELQSMIDELGEIEGNDEELIARSRRYLLQALSSKVAIETLTEFRPPDPDTPILSSALDQLTGAAAGEGTAAFVLSTAGPWRLDGLSLKLVTLEVDGGAPQTADFSELLGPALFGRNQTPFNFTPPAPTVPPADPSTLEKRNRLHLAVDSQVYEFTVTEWQDANGAALGPPTPSTPVTGAHRAVLSPRAALGFKHLGSPLFVADFSTMTFHDTALGPQTDVRPRVITELKLLRTLTLTNTAGTDRFTATGGTFDAWDAGHYVRKNGDPASDRYEIIEVLSSTEARIDTRTAAASSINGSCDIYGQGSGSSSYVAFAPPLPDLGLATQKFTAPNTKITVGPAIKTVAFAESSRTDAQMVTDINAEPAFGTNTRPYSQPGFHVKARARDGRLIVEGRSRLKVELTVSPTFPEAQRTVGSNTPVPFAILEESSHEVIGLELGEAVDAGVDPFLTAKELKTELEKDLTSVKLEIVRELLREGTLSTGIGTRELTDGAVASLATLGAATGVQLEVVGGHAAGEYVVSAVATNKLTVYRAQPFSSSETGLTYRLFRDRLKLGSAKKGLGSSIKITVQPSSIGWPTIIQYGTLPDLVAIDELGRPVDFAKQGVEVGDAVSVGQTATTVSALSTDGQRLTLAQLLTSDLSSVGFSIEGRVESSYQRLRDDLRTFTRSDSLLRSRRFDLGVEEIDLAFAAVLSPGVSLSSAISRARDALLALGSLLSSSFKRTAEHGLSPSSSTLYLRNLLLLFAADDEPTLSDVLNALQEVGYGRAVDLLSSARVREFYALNHLRASYAGQLLDASSQVNRALPAESASAADVGRSLLEEGVLLTGTDADQVFDLPEDEISG